MVQLNASGGSPEHSNISRLQTKLQSDTMNEQDSGKEKNLELALLPICKGDWVDKWLQKVVEDTLCETQLSNPHEGQRKDQSEAQSSFIRVEARRSDTFATSITDGSAPKSQFIPIGWVSKEIPGLKTTPNFGDGLGGGVRGGISGRGSESGASDVSMASHASWSGRQGRKKIQPESPFKKPSPKESKDKIYQCTWCWKPFKTKYDWRRHEESQHAPQTEWVCMFDGLDVGFMKPNCERSFDRKDHLVQHLRNTHVCEGEHIFRIANGWSRTIEAQDKSWMCGFCDNGLMTWKGRFIHVSKHFEEGMCRANWISSAADGANT